MIPFYSLLAVVVLYKSQEISAAGEWCGFMKCQMYECCHGIFLAGYCDILPMPGDECEKNATRMEDADCSTCAPRFKCIDGRCSLWPIED
ncbi:hypothetical protein TNIN_197411 [Trichonephila inaurata madagascariensis]|uniref:Uncharacterized protein n=1 Tax=Trichonephila inaurata madagascariensis TaxID=2747483 RepID=A0A8X7CIL7_9ARAC|nr:hypothetical protein TNIN_138671 [Trichonephila inaurata madagascariensis]GFY51460.1 hypothetical protein TNIN_191611 [Trichonephila inaurata madagascariensis]GFY74434.1 hypothetical protein TNIN_197411 [Trichonephila inaurata madagascariensis]